LELAHLDDECSIVAPEGIVEMQDEVEMVDGVSDLLGVEVIDVDANDSEPDLEWGTTSSQLMELE
jgi:hypothetical protein